MVAKNPLFGEQREKAGSETFEKYFYQYHWALQQALQRLDDEKEYIVFMEAHEDVVFSDAFDEQANFQFIQVKEKTKPLSLKNLYKVEKNNSIIGKAVSSVQGKPYQDKVKAIWFVASNGFNFKNLLNTNAQMAFYSIHDFNQTALDELLIALKAELNDDIKFTNFEFHKSSLLTSYQDGKDQIVGHIGRLMNKLFPKAYFRAENAYVTIIDELLRKGVNTYDYKEWDDFVKNKGLRSDKLKEVLQSNVNNNFDAIRETLDDIAEELEIKGVSKSKLRKNIENIHLDIYNFNSMYISVIRNIDNILNDNNFSLNNITNEFIVDIVDKIKQSDIISDETIPCQSLVIYCIIRKINEETI